MVYITNILNPFDSFVKFSINHPRIFPEIAKMAMTTSDKNLKTDVSLSLILAYSHLLVTGMWPQFRKVKKSIAKFHTREGDLISASTIASQRDNFHFFYNAFQYEVYEYFNTLKRAKCGSSLEGTIDFGMPDFRQLFCFHNAVVHNLTSPYGFDISMSISAFNLPKVHKVSLRAALVASLEAIPHETWDEQN